MSWEKNIRRVTPYTAGEQPKSTNIIKLNTNETPYPASKNVADTLQAFGTESLRRYPDFNSTALVESLAKEYGLNPNQIFVGVGSDDVISVAFMTFFHGESPILFPDVTYSFYDVWASVYEIPYKQIPLDEEFQFRPDDYRLPNGGIIFPNPNAPTGVYQPLSQIEEIIKANPDSVVIVDEAYIDFGGESAISLLPKYENLLVIQTFSKSRSLAGLRIGFAMGNPKLIAYMNDVKFSINSYTMGGIVQACGVAAIADRTYFEESVAKIIATREWTARELTKLGFTFPESKANFLFASHGEVPAEYLFQALKAQGIYVRYWNKPRISNHLRITIGKQEDMEQFISTLADILAQYGRGDI